MTVRYHPPPSSGFTLIELAIGMAIVGMLLSGALLVGGKLWELNRREGAHELLLEQKTAILDFARKNGRFPMMDMNYDGIETPLPGDTNCPVAFGSVPYKDIDTKGRDLFGQPIQYFVNWQLAKEGNVRPCQALKKFFGGKFPAPNPINVRYYKQLNWEDPAYMPGTCWYPLLKFKNNYGTPVAAVLISAGQNHFPDPPNDTAWSITSATFDLVGQAATFDDIVEHITLQEAYAALNCQ